jgi:exonuclease SbcD
MVVRIGITSDVHLTSRKDHPERYHALEDILKQLGSEEVEHLIVAGDLFDQTLQNYADFEKLCRRYAGVRLHIIPGNHDPHVSGSDFAFENVQVFTAPAFLSIDEIDLPIFMVPYRPDCTMGEVLAQHPAELAPGKWVLVGHGDWTPRLRDVNPYERGVYMPLTTKDVEQYRPRRVFLGHVHMAGEYGKVHLMGSPCGLDISETGRRTFLVFDTDVDQVEAWAVDTDTIYFDEDLVVLPAEDEQTFVRNAIEEMLSSWNLAGDELAKAQLRLRVRGFTSDKAALMRTIKEALGGITMYKGEPANLDGVSLSDDIERRYVAEKVKGLLDETHLLEEPDEPGHGEILLQAIRTIYEV